MKLTAGNFPAGNFQIQLREEGIGLMVRVTNLKTDGWVEGKCWYSNMKTFIKEVSEMAYVIGADSTDMDAVRQKLKEIAS